MPNENSTAATAIATNAGAAATNASGLTARQLADDIATWICCESPSSSPSSIAQMVALANDHAESLGLATEVMDLGDKTGPLLYVSNRAAGDTREGLLILGHLDTVHPIGTLQQNACRIENDRLYGPGGYDMKAGAYLAVTALGRVAKSSALPVDILLVPDEEVGTHHSRATIERFAKHSRFTLVGEPARADHGKCVTARKGTGMARVHVHGRPAHAGVDHPKGRSAIREMAHQILALEALTDYARGVTVNVGTIRGGTVTNTIPQHCEAMVDFRVPDMDAATDVLAKMRALKAIGPDVRVDIDVELNRPPMVRTEEVARLLKRAQGFADQAGFRLDEAPPTGGGSDGNFTAAMGVPTLDGLGAEGDGAHTLNEYVIVSTLPRRLDFWERLLNNLA